MSKDCTFCTLVVEALMLSWAELPLRSLDGERLHGRIPNIIDSQSMPHVIDSPTKRLFWELRVCLDTVGKTLPHQCREIFPAAIRLTDSNSCLEHEDKICQLGRIYPSSHCPAAYYKGLYKKCIGSHRKACEERKNLAVKGQRHFGRFPIVMPEHTAFRVIDVNRACIVEVPNNCRYVALSYVWESSEFLHLTKHNQQKLYRHGDLLRECIPKTIRDAMG
jgi:hypothetical protein